MVQTGNTHTAATAVQSFFTGHIKIKSKFNSISFPRALNL